jgi:transcription antitermination factor NusG
MSEVSKMQGWYAAYVKSRHEFATRAELCGKGIDAYVPAMKRLRNWKDRRKLVEFPLFPGYIFARLQPCAHDFLQVLRTRGVVNLLSAEQGMPIAVPDEEINSLRLLIESGCDINIYPHLKEGTKIFVKRGIFKGASGTIVRKQDQYMLMVNINILGRSVGVKIYADDMEAA